MAGVVAFIVQVRMYRLPRRPHVDRMQTYFCLRIERITKSKVSAIFCWFLALARLILDCFLTSEVAGAGVFVILTGPRAQALGLATLCIGAVSDVAIAALLCFGLMGARSGFQETDRMLDKLVAYTVGPSARLRSELSAYR